MKAYFFRHTIRLLCLIVILGIQLEVLAQDVKLETQDDVDAFDPSTTEINGYLDIGKFGTSPKITNLSNLSNLTKVDGFLNINFTELSNLDDLSKISSIGGYLRFWANDNLVNCCGIQDLLENEETSIGGIIVFANSPAGCSSKLEVLNANCGMDLIISVTPPCINIENGKIKVYVVDYDSIPFYYEWMRQEDGLTGSGISDSDDFTIDMLGEGSYNITVTNSDPDSAVVLDVKVLPKEADIFEVTQVQTINSSNGLSNGSITITTTGGFEPYNYSWIGTSTGNEIGVLTDSYTIPFLSFGEYNIVVEDALGSSKVVNIALLDEEVQVISCEEPLDIIILNDVSGSVDAVEYNESKEFFVNFLQEVNVGPSADESRAAIAEWSSSNNQEIKIPITGDMTALSTYLDDYRAFDNNTSPHEAIEFGGSYLDANARLNVEKVLILSTDGSDGQISSSLVALADEYKARGFHIISIAFDNAFSEISTREILRRVASVDALAPGAPAYSQLNADLAQNIVFNYLCPIDPGSSATAYFNRDGAIDIVSIEPSGNCSFFDFVEITIDISAYRELSIPAGTPVTFYHNDPTQSGSTPILTWEIPCAIAVDSTETYTITLPMDGPSNIFAALNDDGEQGPPISFPITEIEELAYSNNIDNERICLDDEAAIQVFKYSSLPIPSCDTIVNYTINVCNITEVDAFEVSVMDIAPEGFVLTGSLFNDNGCATFTGSTYDIPANCCFSLFLTYDAGAAENGYYGDQGVVLDGPSDQLYFGFDGSTTTDEDVTIDGSIDCPSTIIEFTKSVNIDESCDDGFVEFAFTINNEMNIPLQGLVFTDILPDPCTWTYIPYGESGLSIATADIVGSEATFTIDEVEANTVATFYMDASLNFWSDDGTLSNTATLDNVPDVVNGGFRTLTSNTTNTQITASPNITLPDTLIVNTVNDTIDLEASISTIANVIWTTSGDGQFIDGYSAITKYIVGSQDTLDGEVMLFISAESDCNETGASVLIQFVDCSLEVEVVEIGECDNMGTPLDGSDDTYEVTYIVAGDYVGQDSLFVLSVDNYLDTLMYFIEHTITLSVDGIGDILTFVDLENEFCATEIEVNQEICTEECDVIVDDFMVFICQNNGTPQDTTDDIYVLGFTVLASNSSFDSTFNVLYNGEYTGPFSYGDETFMTLSADSVLDSIWISDSNIDTCGIWLVVNQESCFSDPPCYLGVDGHFVNDCDDNGTPQDSTDDTYEIEFSVLAVSPSSDSTYNTLYNGQVSGPFNLAEEISLTLSADSVRDSIWIYDSNIDTCGTWLTANQNSCFSALPCLMSIDVLTISDCDDNGTPQDTTDDMYQIDFTALASNPSIDSAFTVDYNGQVVGPFSFGDTTSLILLADSVLDSIWVSDSENDSCGTWLVVNQESCFSDPPCSISINGLTISDCDDNGTPQISTDDFYEIGFIALSTNPSVDSTYTLVYDGALFSPFNYGDSAFISLYADSELDSVWVSDSNINDCGIWIVVNQENCFIDPSCTMVVEGLMISNCDDNGTPQDSTDDIYMVEFSVETDTAFRITQGMDILGPFDRNEQVSISLRADNNSDTLRLTSVIDENCFVEEVVNQNSCLTVPIEIDSSIISIPNVFSPNGDNINDEWFVSTLSDNIKFVECIVYDRWGNKVFISSGVNPVWDGRYKQKSVSEGVYVFVLRYIDGSGFENKIAGDITVIY